MNRSEAAKERARIWKEKDPDYFKKIGAKTQAVWEANGRAKRGFSVMDKTRLSEVGRKGGAISKRGKNEV